MTENRADTFYPILTRYNLIQYNCDASELQGIVTIIIDTSMVSVQSQLLSIDPFLITIGVCDKCGILIFGTIIYRQKVWRR